MWFSSRERCAVLDVTEAKIKTQTLVAVDHLALLRILPSKSLVSSPHPIRYDPLTFAHPTFPIEASATIEHLCGSVYLRVKKKRTVDVVSLNYDL